MDINNTTTWVFHLDKNVQIVWDFVDDGNI